MTIRRALSALLPLTFATASLADVGPEISPDRDLPPHITRLTLFGERADFSHDGKRVLFLEKTFGDVYEVDLETKQPRLLTGHFPHHGYTRALYLANGDILVSGPERFDPERPENTRVQCVLSILGSGGTKRPVPLGTKCSEGPAVSRKRLHIAWTLVAAQYPGEMPADSSRIYEADIMYAGGTPKLGPKRLVLDSRDLPFRCTLEAQNFRPPHERELTFSAYGHQGTDACGVDLETKRVTNYSDAADQYDEPEGIAPDGQWTLVECDREGQSGRGPSHVDIWKLSLDGNKTWERLTYFNTFPGYKASNPVVSDDGRLMAFQMAKSRDAAGVGYGIFLYDFEKAAGRREVGDESRPQGEAARVKAAAPPRINVGPIRRVGSDSAKYFEPWIAANPRDASNLVVVGSLLLSEKPRKEPVAWFTTDGGANWTESELAGKDGLGGEKAIFADAHATYAPDGTAFCVFMGGPKNNKGDIWIWRSDDGGRRWRGPTMVPGFLDYPRLAADMLGGHPRVFVVANGPGDGPFFGKSKRTGYGCVVLRSDDGAQSFSAANLLAPTTLLHTPIESPSILPDGRLVVGFADFPDMPAEKKPQAHITHGRFYAATSSDGGATFSLPAPIRDTRFHEGYGDGFVTIAVDRSNGPRSDRIYALTYNRSDDPPGLQLQTSQNAVDWTLPAPVPGLRRGPTPLAVMAVSSHGVLGLSWIQTRPGDLVRPFDKSWTKREHTWELYFTASGDGGKTFAPPVPVLKTPSRTDPKMGFWVFGGDYHSLAASADGAFHPVWIDTRDGKAELQTARIEVQP